MSTGKDYGVEEVGTLKLNQVPKKEVLTGDVGYLITGIKEAKDVKVGCLLYTSPSPRDE